MEFAIANRSNPELGGCSRLSEDEGEDQIDNGVNDEDENNISNTIDIGESSNKLVKEDISKIKESSELCSLKNINNYDPVSWVGKRPSELLHLLSSLCCIDINTADEKKMKCFAIVIEMVYYCVNSRIILPNHFLETLLCYSMTNSKTYLNFIGSRSPGGGYSFITNWLKQQNID